MKKVRCSCCDDIRNDHKDFIRGGVDESDFEPDFRYVRLKKKDKKFCPKEKDRVPCQKAMYVVTYRYYSTFYEKWKEHGHWECVKCHRKKWRWY